MSDWQPHVTVATIIENNGKFLMVEEYTSGSSAAVINQPAGHVEAGETLVDAAIRETMEETRWRVSIESYLGIYVYTSPANGVTYYRHCFTGQPLELLADLQLDEGIIAAHWLDYDALVARREKMRSPIVLKCIEDYINGQRYPLDIVYEHP